MQARLNTLHHVIDLPSHGFGTYRLATSVDRKALKKALIVTLVITCSVTILLGIFVWAKFGATAPPTSVLEKAIVGPTVTGRPAGDAAALSPGVTLPDLVYFGTAWQLLSKKVGSPPIVLGGGYTNARVERTGDGLFFAGLVDRLGPQGKVADVVIAYGGAQAFGDFIQGNALAKDRVLEEPKWAAVLLERIWNDPRYVNAHIYVTGHSLGAGYAQFVGTGAIAKHGIAAVQRRMTIVGFGVPNWARQSARYYRVRDRVLDGIFTGYTAQNDPVITNGGTERVGKAMILPPFTGLQATSIHGLNTLVNRIGAHWPTTYISALGLPVWLTDRQKAAYIQTISCLFITGNSVDPAYGPIYRPSAIKH